MGKTMHFSCCEEVEEGKKAIFLKIPCTTHTGRPFPQLYCRECLDMLPDFVIDDCREAFGDFEVRS